MFRDCQPGHGCIIPNRSAVYWSTVEPRGLFARVPDRTYTATIPLQVFVRREFTQLFD